MKRTLILLFTLIWITGVQAQHSIPDWPVLKEISDIRFENLALPVGGIGTGNISIGARGDLRDWEIMNRPAKGFVPTQNMKPFFCVNVRSGDQKITKVLEGPIPLHKYDGFFGSTEPNHGMPRFRAATFKTTYPFAQVDLIDNDVPLDISIESYNPFILGNADDSDIPIMILNYKVTNNSDKDAKVSIAANIPNFIGNDGFEVERKGNGTFVTVGENQNKNTFRKDDLAQGIFMFSNGVDSLSPQWGTIALTTKSEYDVSYTESWSRKIIFEALTDIWDDFHEDGKVEPLEHSGRNAPLTTLSISQNVPAGETVVFPFYITWHFPNRVSWTKDKDGDIIIGNYYTTRYGDAWDVINREISRIPELRDTTLSFVRDFAESDFPKVLKEAALFNLSTLRSQTCFRTPNGYLNGYEGCFDNVGCCFGNSTHVWNYEQATPFVFGELAKTMRIAEFKYATDENGFMSFRIGLPLDSKAQTFRHAAADGQMGSVMQVYREWQLSGDDEFLKELWPKVKKAIGFAWVENGWDPDQDGVMEGCQHNTMDVEYFGPNPLMGFWYLGALKAASKMASYLKEDKLAKKYESLFKNGSQFIDDSLFNGEYYKQIIYPAPPKDEIQKGLYIQTRQLNQPNPHWQLGEGCLIDQLSGQYMAYICDLGYLANQDNIKATLKSIMKYNYKPNVFNHLNYRRSYVLDDESALLMVGYPYKKEDRPFIYAPEAMTGFEYTAASCMIYEEMEQEGIKCITNIRNRYDGVKRNVYDELEAGHHYVRAMASWSSLLAWSGFHYSGVERKMKFDGREGKYFWSNGYSWGTCTMQTEKDKILVQLKTSYGSMPLEIFEINGFKPYSFGKGIILKPNETKSFTLNRIP